MSLKLTIVACLLTLAHTRSLSPRIIGSHNAIPGEFPYQVSLQWGWLPFLPHSHFCGGSIINSTWVVTAAHCVSAMKEFPKTVTFLVKAGKHDIDKLELSEQISSISKSFIHDRYNDSAGVSPYDIALIKLKIPLVFNKRVAPVALPEKDSDPEGIVTLSGWGAVNNNTRDPNYPSILQTADMPIIDRKTCNNAIEMLGREANQTLKDMVDETNICTGPLSGGTAACSGDSGGPLTLRKNGGNSSELVGIVSWGIIPCGRVGGPSVYVRVSSFRDWIADKISKN
ncbi:trypsin-like [Copidosoma floridanum]|uniref:trypsin-like n=1 Tax=Copidosoma floridanum TaxID=29053 RepID=UPI0006C93CC3|nr:trypsin-like [Copidosoma floridanum]